jgi:hypothetical protein
MPAANRMQRRGEALDGRCSSALAAEPSNDLFELIQIKAMKCDLFILLHRHAETNWPYTMENRSSEWEARG